MRNKTRIGMEKFKWERTSHNHHPDIVLALKIGKKLVRIAKECIALARTRTM